MCYSFVLLGNYTLNVKRTSNSQTFLARLTLILRAQLTFQLSLWRKQKKKPKQSHSHKLALARLCLCVSVDFGGFVRRVCRVCSVSCKLCRLCTRYQSFWHRSRESGGRARAGRTGLNLNNHWNIISTWNISHGFCFDFFLTWVFFCFVYLIDLLSLFAPLLSGEERVKCCD